MMDVHAFLSIYDEMIAANHSVTRQKTDSQGWVGFAIARQRLHPLSALGFATRFRLGVQASQKELQL
jgi:hypothetical protein